jgi:acetolactate synthase-1/2/3 large subunit
MADSMLKYSDYVCQWLKDLGYTHCFTLGGGQIMHMSESAGRYFTCIPVVHEVAAGIAAEYFTDSDIAGKAFALVTAGPGLTNLITAIGSAYTESRELLVIGGQVRLTYLSHGKIRQRGTQEIDGVGIVKPISKHAERMNAVWSKQQFQNTVREGFTGKKGPIFIEMPLDIQGMMLQGEVPTATGRKELTQIPDLAPSKSQVEQVAEMVRNAKRPLVLIGGGVSRKVCEELDDKLAAWGIPLSTTWNGADRIGFDHPLYMGRPNTFGQRYSNLINQQADLVVALGTRLGLQQTGFNWQQFAPVGKIVHVDIDTSELEKGHPRTDLQLAVDANQLLRQLVDQDSGDHSDWLAFCRKVKAAVPLIEPANTTAEGYVPPQEFITWLSDQCTADDLIVPCSSGNAFIISMLCFKQKRGQVILTNKGLASMGYGLSGAIGVAIAGAGRRTILVEGDGGFAQNIQEIGTAAINKLPLKMFIFDDHGYASIRQTQRNYFGGRYAGCDTETGVGLPQWEKLFAAFDVPVTRLKADYKSDATCTDLFNAPGPAAFIVSIDPEQTYFPKITSRILASGDMESNPLHLMTPPLSDELHKELTPFLAQELSGVS